MPRNIRKKVNPRKKTSTVKEPVAKKPKKNVTPKKSPVEENESDEDETVIHNESLQNELRELSIYNSADMQSLQNDVALKQEIRRQQEQDKREHQKLREERLSLEKKIEVQKSLDNLLTICQFHTRTVRENVLKQYNVRNDNTSESDIYKKKCSDIKNLILFEGALKEYQIEGVVWMKDIIGNYFNCILADEMGLGKTVQIIALICQLYELSDNGPHLIICPLSTLPNWELEFKKFAPKIPVVVYHGNPDKRLALHKDVNKLYVVQKEKVPPVVITTYEILLLEKQFLKSIEWKLAIVDEAQRCKNHESLFNKELRTYTYRNLILLTGTPVQNNMMELWSLLNLLLPALFSTSDLFIDISNKLKNLDGSVNEELSINITKMHEVLQSFMLRRLKKDVVQLPPKKEVLVYCPLSKLQLQLYKEVLDEIISEGNKENEIDPYQPRTQRECTKKRKSYVLDELFDENDEDLDNYNPVVETPKVEEKERPDYIIRKKMTNPQIMLRNIATHPYFFKYPVEYDNKGQRRLLISEELVNLSGKMLVLDAMLNRLKQQGHKVLIFTVFTTMLDYIGHMMKMRSYSFRSLQGSTTVEERKTIISQFNTDPSLLAVIISTRAGGVGINLTAADTVIFIDSDWNPQSDSQAEDRCHRIGQTKPVIVYRFVVKNTIDERIIATGNSKRVISTLILHGICKDTSKKSKPDTKGTFVSEMQKMQKMVEDINAVEVVHSNGYIFTDQELDNLMDRSKLL